MYSHFSFHWLCRCVHCLYTDSETHFKVVVVSETFEGMPLLKVCRVQKFLSPPPPRLDSYFLQHVKAVSNHKLEVGNTWELDYKATCEPDFIVKICTRVVFFVIVFQRHLEISLWLLKLQVTQYKYMYVNIYHAMKGLLRTFRITMVMRFSSALLRLMEGLGAH